MEYGVKGSGETLEEGMFLGWEEVCSSDGKLYGRR